MTAYSDQVKDIIKRYQNQYPSESGLFDPIDVAAWALQQGLYKPNQKTLAEAVADDIRQVLREEYRIDGRGRRYRANHAVIEKVGKKQMSLWADIDDRNAPRKHFVASFGQRRKQIVGDCVQLKNDVDVYNDKHSDKEPIPLILNFEDDVDEELGLSRYAA